MRIRIERYILILIFLTVAHCELFAVEVQWAQKVIGFSTELTSEKFSSNQLLDEPSVMPDFGFSACAWTPKIQNSTKEEWIHVIYKTPMKIRQVAIAENFNPGTITKVIVYDSDTRGHIVYRKNRNEAPPRTTGRMFNIFMGLTSYEVSSVKIYLNTSLIDGWNQIDAVGISDQVEPIIHKINIAKGSQLIYAPENLGKNINSKFHELAPVISPDGRTLYFTRDRHPDNFGYETRQDVWYSSLIEDGNFTVARNLGYPINNEQNNFAISITPDGNSLLLGNVYKKEVKFEQGVSISYFDGDNWSFPEKLIIDNYYNINKITSYCLGSNAKTLIMAVERDDTFGSLDLYVSFLKKDGSWSEPKNMGNTINTADSEASPFLAADGTTLYYSTGGFPGYGNNDLFITRRLDDTWTNWSPPENLGPVLNSEGWDAFFTIPASGDYGYMVSTENTIGNEDIFRVLLPPSMRPNPVALISGRVLNAKTKEPVAAKIIYETLKDGKEFGIARSNPRTGAYKIVLPAGEMYGFLAEAEGFVAVNQHLDLRKSEKYEEIGKDLLLVPIEHGQTIKLNNIFFDFNKFELLQESFSELNRVVAFMNENPTILIEIRGHTCDIGTTIANQELSEQRAKAVSDYLISKGVNPIRLIVRGLGETNPIVPNIDEENRMQNRRVEFVIFKD